MTYSSTLAMNRQRFGQRNQNSTSFQKKGRTIGPVSNTIILIVLACILGLLYLTQVTKTNAYGYKINNLQDQQSLDRVQASDAAKSLVSVAPTSTVQN
jgi:hypothetical protein